MKTNKYVEFDMFLDIFLSGKMSRDEESIFQGFLNRGREWAQRARFIALVIKTMFKIQPKRDETIVEAIKSMDEDSFVDMIRSLADNKEVDDFSRRDGDCGQTDNEICFCSLGAPNKNRGIEDDVGPNSNDRDEESLEDTAWE